MKYSHLILEFLFIYLILINITSFLLFFIDKKRARKHLFRIPESSLFLLSTLGGSLGSIFGMKVFKHKTRKKNFIIIIPILLVLNIISTIYILRFFGK